MIKRCPFCGKKGKATELMGFWGVSCSNEKCGGVIAPEYKTEAEAIRAWNKRTETSYNLNPDVVINYLEEQDAEKKKETKKYVKFMYDGLEIKVPKKFGTEEMEDEMEKAVSTISEVEFETPESIIEKMGDEMVYCTHCLNINEIDGELVCLCSKPCYFGDPEDAAPRSKRVEYKEPELGNLLFGNARGTFAIDRDPIGDIFWKYFEELFDYHMYFEGKNKDNITDRGGYENDIFIANPYYWGDDDDIADEPNFIYKPEGIEISWYKYPMRDAYSSVHLTPEKAEEIFRICRESMNE